MRQLGVFEHLRGVVIGSIDGMEGAESPVPKLHDVLLALTADYAFPILKVSDFGHNCPKVGDASDERL